MVKKAGLVVGAFLSFLFILWGLLLVYEEHHADVIVAAFGGILIAGGLTFFWVVERFRARP